jgi:hypothetical protein
VRATSMSVTGPAEVVEDGVGYRTRAGKWRCLGGCWRCGECVCERRGRGEVSSDGATMCSAEPLGVSVRALARLGGMGTSWLGLCNLLLGRWLVPAGSVEQGQPPGHAEVSQGREKGRVGMVDVMVIGMGLSWSRPSRNTGCQCMVLSRRFKQGGMVEANTHWLLACMLISETCTPSSRHNGRMNFEF